MGFDHAYINAILGIVAGKHRDLYAPRPNGEPYVPDNSESVRHHIGIVQALKRHLYTTPSYREAGFFLTPEDIEAGNSMLPCWRLDKLYESGHREYKDLAIEICSLHINDPKWPKYMTNMLCQN